MARTSRTDWLDEGLSILRESGDAGLTIEALCRRLGRTKGAYYHHFGEAEGFFSALLAHWEHEQTGKPIDLAEKESAAPAKERRRRLISSVVELDMRLESAVRAWALHDAQVRLAVGRVDERRVAYLAQLNREEGLPAADARAAAALEYATGVGAQQLYGDLRGPEAQALFKTLQSALRVLRRRPS